MELGVGDILEIHNLINRYGHIVDERQWSRMEDLFTDDVIFDMADFNGQIITGLEALRTAWKSLDGHPLAHHATNILIDTEGDEVRVLCKGIAMYPDHVGSTVYRDRLRKTAAGWRIAHRIAAKRRYETIPAAS